jgi:N-acetylglutamate synthase-like GNAT family acetyltransferase
MCLADKNSGEIIVVAIMPDYEGHGVGKQLLQLTLNDLKELGYKRSFLGCNSNPESRSYGFYRHLGWISTGERDNSGDEILEIFLK